ncbi:MAG: hypothetical protein K6F33_07200 [Bacteroidales bacterium]|nr:hypothetical protein [Bacteroidales bacterium]
MKAVSIGIHAFVIFVSIQNFFCRNRYFFLDLRQLLTLIKIIMTAAALKLKSMLDSKISSFNERKLMIMLVMADVLSESQFIDNQSGNNDPDIASDTTKRILPKQLSPL